MQEAKQQALVGRLVDIDHDGNLRERQEHLVIWDSTGQITAVCPLVEAKKLSLMDNLEITFLPHHSFLVPGAIDCHIHYPQTRIIGGFGADLLEWLNLHVWPEEARFDNEAYAEEVAKQFLRAMVSSGTTATMVFGSQFEGAMHKLFSLAHQLGLHLVSGLVGQDRESIPILERSTHEYERLSHSLIKSWHRQGRIRYAVLPRFSIACSPVMLETCGSLLAHYPDLYMQTHINESIHEIQKVHSLFPGHRNYLDTYESFGLLGERSSFAHSIHTTHEELSRLKEHRCQVVHCPSSNSFLGSGAFPYQLHQTFGLPIGVGTDVGAGLSFSMWKEMGHAHLIQMRLHEKERVLWTGSHMLKAMTVDGATFLGVPKEIGRIEPGYKADLVWIEPPTDSYLGLEKDWNQALSLDNFLFRLAISQENSIVAKTWINGRMVFSREENFYIHPLS